MRLPNGSLSPLNSLLVLSFLMLGAARALGADAPYPRSDVLTGIAFDHSTLQRVAEGSDIWATTGAPAEKKRPAYLHTFPVKWMNADGTTLWCIFDRGDHFNLARCTLSLKPRSPAP